jgi:hypothetical protein
LPSPLLFYAVLSEMGNELTSNEVTSHLSTHCLIPHCLIDLAMASPIHSSAFLMFSTELA